MTFLLILKKMVSFGLFRRLPSERTFSKVEIRPQELKKGDKLPDFHLKSAVYGDVSSAELKGKVVLVSKWPGNVIHRHKLAPMKKK